MCVCPNSNQEGGPYCDPISTIIFDADRSSLVYDTTEPAKGESGIVDFDIPLRRQTNYRIAIFPYMQLFWTIQAGE